MIRPLRRAHRAVFLVLAILLPVAIAIAVAGREVSDPPNSISLPATGPR